MYLSCKSSTKPEHNNAVTATAAASHGNLQKQKDFRELLQSEVATDVVTFPLKK